MFILVLVVEQLINISYNTLLLLFACVPEGGGEPTPEPTAPPGDSCTSVSGTGTITSNGYPSNYGDSEDLCFTITGDVCIIVNHITRITNYHDISYCSDVHKLQI